MLYMGNGNKKPRAAPQCQVNSKGASIIGPFMGWHLCPHGLQLLADAMDFISLDQPAARSMPATSAMVTALLQRASPLARKEEGARR